MKYGALAALLLLIPGIALAAGFAKQSLFLSQPSVTEGDTVLIHAVVSNDNSSDFSGTLVFSDDGAAIGSVPVALKAGESSVVSVSWKPSAGSQPVSATLEDSAGTTIESQQQTFSIASKPLPQTTASSNSAAAVDSAAQIQQGINDVSPAAEQYTAPVFNTIDSARSSAAGVLDNQLASTKARIAPDLPGEVLGAEAVKNSTSNPAGGFMYLLNTLYFYLLTLLRFIIGSAIVFYPLLAAAFLYIIWKGFRHFRRRPAY